MAPSLTIPHGHAQALKLVSHSWSVGLHRDLMLAGGIGLAFAACPAFLGGINIDANAPTFLGRAIATYELKLYP